jgi:hypothetical protein
VRDKTVYRLLSESQFLGEALFSNFLEERSKANVDLSDVWNRFEKKASDLLGAENISLGDIDYEKNKAIEKLKRTNIRREMREAVSDAAREVGRIIEKFKETPKVEEKNPPNS